jgi:hypothetical protein
MARIARRIASTALLKEMVDEMRERDGARAHPHLRPRDHNEHPAGRAGIGGADMTYFALQGISDFPLPLPPRRDQLGMIAIRAPSQYRA